MFNRRVIFELSEASRLVKVIAKLDVDFSAILNLQRKVEEYRKRVCNPLPLMLFDDFQTEAVIIKRVINERRWSQ